MRNLKIVQVAVAQSSDEFVFTALREDGAIFWGNGYHICLETYLSRTRNRTCHIY